ncbi:hypothetical protein GC105_07980 [Alkalibaculum sp. M08DMB]|uniref:Uncharacterized protein n=1 Tax=Alkalibaculum sporogenes TaxID=2655001 RepID=A0A6A7K8K5_9FIRM|nr:hypothetical protein [Alkalibaculum sporogenes]MPW25726.1 hypothetical protein [Alkalibaculum sporogenes]
MFEYTFEANEDIKLLTSHNLQQVNKKVITYENFTSTFLTYADGFSVEMKEYTDKVIIKSNRELVENGDGTLDVLI